MLTKRCSLPSLTRRAAMPGCRASRSSITSATVAPFASTDFSPPVWVRRMVGTETVTAMLGLQVWWDRAGRASGVVGHVVRAGVREHVALDGITLDDRDVFLGDHAVHDPVGPQLLGLRPRGDDHVVDARVAGGPGRQL